MLHMHRHNKEEVEKFYCIQRQRHGSMQIEGNYNCHGRFECQSRGERLWNS